MNSTSGSYQLYIKGVEWLRNGSSFLQADNRHHSTEDGTLIYMGVDNTDGKDRLGEWYGYTLHYQVDIGSGKLVRFDTQARMYWKSNMVVFAQVNFL